MDVHLTDDDKKTLADAMNRAINHMTRIQIQVGEDGWYLLPHRVKIGTLFGGPPNVIEIDQWCEQTFGRRHSTNLNPEGVWARCREGVFNFKHDADRTAFILRWSRGTT